MKQLLALLAVVSVLVLTGCSNVYSQEDGYRMAIINQGFPVPKEAYEVKAEDCIGEISKSAKYKLKGIGDADGNPPDHYLRTIEEWGWVEMVEDRRGSIHFYEKQGKIMSLNIKENVFDVFEMTSATES
ncbi:MULTISPECIES: hypothetical protein [unclassified Sporosarcina]|uniref:hypothetical protein n=1 Tax=unclassified Sporosarcina TaxID=2647733 RepID=UPI000C168DB0|nr:MULTISPECIES: hypothetical protein [unclassified Sporosarcina]PIC98362.1 hypothetical protein CSV68_13620 [Sporosarcina sp. P29]PID05934.1 hypothetical protein CSV66_06910 [Sporosarcina sp. P30]PID09128.1 hypothetical protein CSV65_06910 [Sporosarcina sp. P31]PID12426.1 hypothetical protein CSV64_06380 [Sporosarcina sp. P32b]